MKVADLLPILAAADPDAEVIIYDEDEGISSVDRSVNGNLIRPPFVMRVKETGAVWLCFNGDEHRFPEGWERLL